ncbi:MAG: glycosyltransferase family 39 protein [Planctomycetota bacterium]
MTGSTKPTGWRWKGAVVVLAAAVALLAGLGREPSKVEAEQRCEAIVRDMAGGGGWLVPSIGGEVRPQKPPLFYWCSALACKAAGGFGLAAFRLPSALAAIGVLLLVLAWGRELRAPGEAVFAAAVLAVTYEFLAQGRRGSYEMLLAFLANASLLAGYRACREPGAARVAIASALLALALMAKATPALLFAPLPLAVWAVAQRRPRMLLDRRAWLALLAALVGVVSWYAYIWFSAPEVRWFIQAQFLQPFGIQVGPPATAHHLHPPWWYFGSLGRKGLLLSLVIPLLALREWRERRTEGWSSPWRLLLLAVVVPFAVLSCLPTKQDHYLLPMLPSLALLAARASVWAIHEARGLPLRLLRIPALLVLVLAVAAGTAGGPALGLLGLPVRLSVTLAGAGIAALAALSIFACVRARVPMAALAGYLAVVSGWTLYFAEIHPDVAPLVRAASSATGSPRGSTSPPPRPSDARRGTSRGGEGARPGGPP